MSTNTIRLHRVIRSTPEKIYRAFLDPDAKAKWLPASKSINRVFDPDPIRRYNSRNRFPLIVVLPTPPFMLMTDTTGDFLAGAGIGQLQVSEALSEPNSESCCDCLRHFVVGFPAEESTR
jgi:hypothetical protein